MINLAMEFLWSSTPTPIEQIIQNPEIKIVVPFGTIMQVQAPVTVSSVNGQVGNVWLGAYEVGADPRGSAENVQSNLTDAIQEIHSRIDIQIASVTQLLNDKTLVLSNGVETNRLEILKRASLALVEQLQQSLVDYAKMNYVDERISTLVGQDQQILATIQQLSSALAQSEDLIEALEYTVANRVRFDVANQALTSLQKYNARTNIGAEEIGTAKLLIDAITADSIGAATKAQGLLAQSAIQSADLAPVALSGKLSDLSSQDKIYDIALTNWAIGSNASVANNDTLREALGKIQCQINTLKPEWVPASSIGTVNPLIVPVTIGTKSYGLEFCKRNGSLWIRGYFIKTGGGGNGEYMVDIKDNSYKLISKGIDYAAISCVFAWQSGNSNGIGFRAPAATYDQASAAANSQQIILLVNATVSAYHIPEQCLGKLAF